MAKPGRGPESAGSGVTPEHWPRRGRCSLCWVWITRRFLGGGGSRRETVVVLAQPETRTREPARSALPTRCSGRGRLILCVYGHQSNIQVDWTDPFGLWPGWHRRLSEFARLILFDPRGMGGSDRVATPSLEERMDDLRAVLDAVGSRRTALLGVEAGAWMPMLFAATHPERTLALVLYAPRPRMTWTADYPWGPTPDAALPRSRRLHTSATSNGGAEARRTRDPRCTISCRAWSGAWSSSAGCTGATASAQARER
jgi:pimeloyl-ACP methyl ester carboxylesterase